MATNAALPWSVAIKPLLSTSYPSFPKSDIPEFTKAILRSERDILEHDEEYEPFYSSFVALAAHFLTTECISLSGTSLTHSAAACKVLMRFLLQRMQSRSESCTISQKYLMILIRGLCKGGSCLSKSDVVTFTSMMKASKQPPFIRSDTDYSEGTTELSASTGVEGAKDKDKKLLRLDTGSNLFDQLTSVLDQSAPPPVARMDQPALEPSHLGDLGLETGEESGGVAWSLGRKNVTCLLQLNGANMLVEALTRLPFMAKFQQRYRDAIGGHSFLLPATLAEALTTRNLYQSVLSDVTVVWMAFSLPIMEPLTPKRLEQIITCTLSCLYAAVTVASADTIINMIKPATSAQPASKDEETEGYGRSIVQKALEVFNTVSVAVRNSTRAGGNVAQNLHLLAAWVLLKGLQGVMAHTPALILERKDSAKREGTAHKTKEASRPLAAKSGQQGFSVAAVALASSAMQLLTSLLEDLQIEGSVGDLEISLGDVAPGMDVKLLTSMSAWQRVRRLLATVSVVDLLFNLVMVSFRKAVMLKRSKQGSEAAETSSSSTSDSNTFYEDDFSTTEDSSEEEDSEPILGEWLEGTLSPEDEQEPLSSPFPPRLEVQGESSKRSRQPSTDEPPSLVPDKREPDGFLTLASSVLGFMTTSIINSSDVNIRRLLKNSMSEEHAHILAGLVRDLDREITRSSHDKVYEEVSVSVARFNHSLIASQSISEPLQDQLLHYLGVGTTTAATTLPASITTPTTQPEPWPLTISTHTLTLLTEVLLLRQQREREKRGEGRGGTGVDGIILSIWTRFLASLKSAILTFDNRAEQFEDVNVEHLQVLIFLFHSLQLTHKKTLLVQVAQIIIAVADMDNRRLAETVPLPLSRLMLVMEYLLHYLYDPPPALMDQVQWNLFTVYTLAQGTSGSGSSSRPDGDGGGPSARASHYFQCREVEDHFRKSISTLEGSEVGNMKPRFYNLSPTDNLTQDVPKIDGLAGTCLLSNQETLDYNMLYMACIKLLMAGSRCDLTKAKLSPLDASAMHYHFLLVWRLLACLPPSVAYLDTLADTSPSTPLPGSGFILHTLRWVPRLAHKAFTSWVKDCLSKQGLTAEQAEKKLTSATATTNDLSLDTMLAVAYIKQLVSELPAVLSDGWLVVRKELPGLSSILMLDAALAKLQVSLDHLLSSSSSGETEPKKNLSVVTELMPAIQCLIHTYSTYVRSCVMQEVLESDDKSMTAQRLRAYCRVLSLGSSTSGKVAGLGASMMALLPSPVKNAIDKWALSAINEFPPLHAWRNAFANDTIPCESYMDTIHSAHMITLSGQQNFCIHASIRHVLSALVSFGNSLLSWSSDAKANKDFTTDLLPLLFDATTEHMAESVMFALERAVGPADSEELNRMMYHHAVVICHDIIVSYSDAESGLDEKILQECIRFMDTTVETLPGARALHDFYSTSGELTKLLLCVAREGVSASLLTRVLKFFNKLFMLAEKEGADQSYTGLCSCLSGLAKVDPAMLQALLYKIFTPPQEEEEEAVRQNRSLLHSLAVYIVRESSHIGEEVSIAVLMALIPMGAPLLKDGGGALSGFPELMMVMKALAMSGKGSGHLPLFQATTHWLTLCKSHLSEKEVREHLLQSGKPNNPGLLETLCCLLSYIGDVLAAIKRGTDRAGSTSPSLDVEAGPPVDADSDWAEDMTQEEEDSGGEDSDEESLNNKLCTFTITQKEFMNQHWYHCHTCKMVDGVGVCTVCAKVCHKDHDLSYAKFGSFFCDCGAKEDGSCKALVKRTAQSGIDSGSTAISQSPFAVDTFHHHHSSLRRRLSSPGPDDKLSEGGGKMAHEASEVTKALMQQIETYKVDLLSHMEESNTVQIVLDILQCVVPPLTDNYQEASPMGSTARAHRALQLLHTQAKKIETTTDQLMTVTLGSQEGAFENVRMNYSGDQGQTIRQLITAHMLRRVAMCVLSSPQGKRQHLAVSHEKGKITILQLSALLKQADSSKKKLTLTRLSSAPIPFTVLSIVGNSCNEDFLAVCGLKDCHVLTFTGSGTVSDHLVLHPSLTTGNFIIKAVWLPGCQTELAVVTADFVKIYDLSLDAISPQYYFLLPSGKIRDATFLFGDEGRHMVLMASSGYIYTQVMEDSSSARHGPFYITNVLEVKHAELKDVNGQVAGGGVSVYYSHALQLLFFSYAQGKSFSAPVAKDLSKVTNLFPITFKCSNGGGGKGSGSGGVGNQPLVQWSEVAGHTGLLYCMVQSSSNPVVLMVRPDAILMQEIKVVPAKAKIQDVVAIRHVASTCDQQQRTTMILLCEDGSLRIYMANVESTNYWLSPFLQPQSPIAALKPAKKKKQVKSGRPVGIVNFPIDFFEHCQQSSDVEFGGNDVLQVYNIQQVKHRLNTTGMYVASTKSAGFSLEIQNTQAANVMVGVRVLLGSQTADKAPSYLEIFGRTVPVSLTRARWFDMPFTREESLTADKKATLFVGPSADPAGVTMLDSVKVYVKTKEAFGWPEEPDEFPEPPLTSKVPVSTSGGIATAAENDSAPSQPIPMTSADRLLGSGLEVLDGAFASVTIPDSTVSPPKATKDMESKRAKALELATKLLTLPSPAAVQQHVKSLLASLFPSPQVYHNHKDQALLEDVLQRLKQEGQAMAVESFQRLVVTARSVAVTRPTNLLKFAEAGAKEEVLELMDLETEKDEKKEVEPSTPGHMYDLDPREQGHFTSQLMSTFWKLHAARPANPMLAPVCLPGLSHIDATVRALVEIITAFCLCDSQCVAMAAKHLVHLLLSLDVQVSSAACHAIIRALRPRHRHRRRRVFIPTPPICSSPGPGGADDDDDDEDDDKGDKPDTPSDDLTSSMCQPAPVDADIDNEEAYEDNVEPMVLELGGEGGAQANPLVAGLEAMWAGENNFPPIVDIPPDADDETMVELAIALSLQEQPLQQAGQAGALGLQGLGLVPPPGQEMLLEEAPLSDTTASAPGSDDEVGSNAATDGSTLRTSPAEHAGSAGSESGGSAVDSISATSGRSSAYGFQPPESLPGVGGRSETSSVGGADGSIPPEQETFETEAEADISSRLHSLRLLLLERMLQYLGEVGDVGGGRAVPFMQVLLMLTSDMDSEEDRDRAVLDTLLSSLLHYLDLSGKDLSNVESRSKKFEAKLIILRLLSVLLSRSRSGSKTSGESSFVTSKTASALLSSGALPYCLQVLHNLMPYWKEYDASEEELSGGASGQLLKPHSSHPAPDMSPFFLRQYVKCHANDVFEEYPQLLTEMVLRLPYQLKKIAESGQKMPPALFDPSWHSVLSEYMMTQLTPFMKRQVRKLLLFICGSKEKYRQLRDEHAVESHLAQVKEIGTQGGWDQSMDLAPHTIVLPYDTLLTLIEHLKVCSEIATSRPYNWQTYCQQHQDTLPYIVCASIVLDEGVAPTLLTLLQVALCGVKGHGESQGTPESTSSTTSISPVKVDAKKALAEAKKSKSKAKKKKKKEDKKDSGEGESQRFDEVLSMELVELLISRLDHDTLVKFVRTFLLESNASGNRWLAHSLVLRIYQNATSAEQEALLDLLWALWEELPVFGRKAAQFRDLLGYFVLKMPSMSLQKKIHGYLEKAVSLLRAENHVLAHHPNASIYNMLQGLVDFDGYYLESDPCLVCNNPEVPYTNLKLSAVKVDSKFTTTTQIVKLVGSHTIAKISLRISDLKRTKMVRTLNIYYNNRSVQAVVELKNRPGLWHKAKKVTLTAGQTDVKVEFPIPIVACNLMLEYADFYDNLQATTETLQCPRCSASVPATPGVCGNCGENVYQCHKCRAINYDEKDPFLCNACGFCKYAKFDLTLLGKPCCAVDPIENEEDRKKAISTINSLLEKADRTYKQLQTHRPILESLLIQVTEHSTDRLAVSQRDEGNPQSSAVPASNVNKAIQLLAQKYCGECKSAFDELSNIIQKVMACRRELVEYDQQQREAVASKVQGNMPGAMARPKVKEVPGCKTPVSPAPTAVGKKEKEGKANTCFGCASAAVEHCITLLRALVTNPKMRQILCSQGMIQQLIDYNLRHGALSVRLEVRSLLCLLTRDNRRATEEMNNLIMTRITSAVKGHQSNPDMASSVRHEILLLSSSLQQEDTCWEQRVRCVMRLFLMGMHMRSPIIMESITLPCLRILQGLIKQDLVTFLGKKREEFDPVEGHIARFHMDVRRWLEGDPDYSFTNWKKRLPSKVSNSSGGGGSGGREKSTERKEVRARYLREKYLGRWRQRVWGTGGEGRVRLTQTTWLHSAIFSPSSRSARQTACSVVESISQLASHRKEVIDMLTGCLEQVGRSGECANEFLALYKRLIAPAHWKIYLAVKGVLQSLGSLITQEVEHLQYLEETTLSSDLAQGYALKALTELLWLFVEHEQIKSHYKNKLVGFILNGYLSLRKLVVQRTKLIDETQERLLELLEELTTGTESETTEFMSVCVQTVQKYPLDDYRSPVFIFERLCSIIYPEENDVGEFFMILEKDPQQEDFLQGRMLGNPYSSNEPGLGPLMRDIKNKICQDCELVALLEDDTGMELLVNKKIISLDLPVKEVYKKVWLPEHGEGEPMPIVYRMRGLLGDATEDMVNTLDTGNEEDIDKEAVFKMAAELKECGGLPVMLERLASVRDLVLGRQLMCVLLKLFSYAVNVKVNRQELIRPDLNTVNIMLGALNLALWAEPEGGSGSGVKGQTITEQILNILEVILLEASEQPPEQYSEFSKLCGDRDQLKLLLDRINSPFVQGTPSVRQALMRLIPFLAFGDPEKMLVLINHFLPYLDFDRFDREQGQDEQNHLDCFSVIACGIESNANGEQLKDVICDHGVVQKAVDYILRHAPEIKTMLSTDSDVWKEFVSKPSLSYALRVLTGLCVKHTKTINLIAERCVPILHKLEQVSSDKHVGTLAENLLDALRVDPSASQKIEDVRQETKAEKKRLAMAVRKKHLGALGMTTNEKGQVTVKSSVLKQMEDLKEETGLTCCICREGYRYQPQKVLAVYTFSKRCNLDEFENKPRKTPGYSTVSHFNVVHVDCHTAAVRHARGREEWESATLQNANTKCNGLLPLWGPQVQESVFAACLARHNNYLQECTGVRDIGYTYTVHDIKLLLLRLAQERSFSNESGGGGRQSNVHILPFMMHITLYVINTTRAHSREEKNISNFLDMPKGKWVENCFETEGPLYYLVLAMHMISAARWKDLRVSFFQRLLLMAHVRATTQSAPGKSTLADKEVKSFSVYKMYLVFFGFVMAMYEKVFKKLSLTESSHWCNVLAEYIRLNDRIILDACDRALAMFENELLPCESFDEYLDVVGMLEEIPNGEEYLSQTLTSLP